VARHQLVATATEKQASRDAMRFGCGDGDVVELYDVIVETLK